MIEVNIEEFYNFIGPTDSVISVGDRYNWPYTMLFTDRYRNILNGKIIMEYTNHQYPIRKSYFICKLRNI